MEFLPNNTLLHFHCDTLEVVRKGYSLDKPEDMNKAIDILEEWVKQQKHFIMKDFSRDYLERSIISNKGSVERAKDKLDHLCTYRTIMPKYFGDFDMGKDFHNVHTKMKCYLLPKLTKDHCRVVMLKLFGKKFEPDFPLNMIRNILLTMEYTKAHDYAKGYIIFIDCTELNVMDLITVLNIAELQEAYNVATKGFEGRFKGVHFWSTSKTVELLVKIVKQVSSKKVRERTRVHNTLESVYEYIPKKLMPSEYGGIEKSLTILHDEWVTILSSKDHREYQREMLKARTDESLRTNNTFKEQYLGIPGTFRALTVD